MSDFKLSVQDSKFLQILKINELTNKNTTADFIRTNIDDRLTGGFYDSVNNILRVVGRSWEDRPIYVMLTFLTSTLAAHHKLPYRSEFFRQTRQRFLKDHDESYTNTILKGLMPSQEETLEDVNRIKDKIEATVVKAPVKVQVESDFSQEIKVMMDKVDKQLKAKELEQEKKFHRREIVRHEQAIDALDKRLSEL